MGDNACQYCKKGVGPTAVTCNTCSAKYHKSCAERNISDVPGVLKCCKGGLSLSSSQPNNLTPNSQGSSVASANKPANPATQTDITRLAAEIKALTSLVSKWFKDNKANAESLGGKMEQCSSRIQNIEDKLDILDTVQSSVSSLTSRVDTLEQNTANPSSSIISCAQEA